MRRVNRWHTGFVDLDSAGGLLGQVEGRCSRDATAWFDARSQRWRHSVRFVAIDPSAAYAAAVRSALPHVQLVVDHLHLVQLADDTVTKVRRRVTWENRGRCGHKVDPEWANRRRLLTARERLREASFARMSNDALDGDPSSQVLKARIAKEELRALLAAARAGGAGMRRADLPPQVPVPRLVRRRRRPRGHHSRRNRGQVVARDRGVLPHRNHERRH